MTGRAFFRISAVILFLATLMSVGFAQSSRSESDFIYAKRLYDDGLYDLAAEALDSYIKTFSDSPHLAEASFLIGESFWHEERFEEARNAFQRVAMEYPDDSRAVRALTRIADSYEVQGQREKTIRALLRIPVFFPSSAAAPSSLVRASRILIETEKWNDAEAPLQQVIQQYAGSPEILEAHLLWAQLLAARGEYDGAIQEAGRVISSDQGGKLAVEALGLQGEWYSRLGRDSEADAAWQEILEAFPDTPERASALVRMGERRLRIGDARKAEPLFREAVETGSGEDLLRRSRVGLGDALFLLVRYEEALAQYTQIKDPSPELNYRIALCYEKMARYGDALARLESVGRFGNDKMKSGAFWRRGFILDKLGRFREASEAYLSAEPLVEKPLMKAEVRYLSISSSIHADPEGALQECDRFSTLYPSSPRVDDIALDKAELLTSSGRYTEAVRAWRDLVRRYPASPLVHEARFRADYIETHLIQKGDPSTKVAGLLAEVAGGLDRRELALRLGKIYLNEYKDFAAAVSQFTSIIDDTTLAQTLRNQARDGMAEAIWRTFERSIYGDSGIRIEDEQKIRDAANGTSAQLIALLPKVNDPALRAETAYRITRLGEEMRDGEERIRYARQAWQSYLADYSNSTHAPESYFRLGEAFSAQVSGDTLDVFSDPSIWYLEVLRDDFPNSTWTDAGLLLLSDRYIKSGRGNEARLAYDRILQHNASPERVEACLNLLDLPRTDESQATSLITWLTSEGWYNPRVDEARREMANHYLVAGDYSAAQAQIDYLLNLDPGVDAGMVIAGAVDYRYAYDLGRVAEGMGQQDVARRQYQQFLAHHPASSLAPLAHLHLADLRARQGYLNAAIGDYRWLVENPINPPATQEAKRALARLSLKAEQWEDVLKWAHAAEIGESNPDSALTFAEWSVEALYRLDRATEASKQRDVFKATYGKRPLAEDSEAHFELERGKLLSRKKQYSQAEDLYRRIIRKYESSRWAPEASYELGRDYLEQKQYEKALDILTGMPVTYAGNPVLGRVFWVLGNYYIESGNLMDGISTYSRVLDDSTYMDIWPQVYHNQIRAYKQAGFYAGALQANQKYLTAFPDAPDTFDRKMDIGLMYTQLGQYDLAITQFRAIQPMANVEDEAACQYYIGEALEKSGRLAEAVIEYKKVDYLGKRTKMQWAVTALYSAGRVLERLNEPGKASDMYKEIVRREGLGSPFGRKAQEQIDRIGTGGKG